MVSFIVNVNSGLKLLFHLNPGIVTSFSYRSMVVHERYKTQGTRNKKQVFISFILQRYNAQDTRYTEQEQKVFVDEILKNIEYHVRLLNPEPCSLCLHKTFRICSFAFSSSSFITTTHFWIDESYAFAPVVLISLPISCNIKESFFPFDSSGSAMVALK